MNTITVNRVYEKRATEKSTWNGRIGATELVMSISPDGNLVATLDGNVLPDASVQYLLNFSLQSLQDAYAGAESIDEATGNWGKKRDALIKGEIGARGEGVSTFTGVARQIMRALLKKAAGPKSEAWVAFIAKSDADQNKVLDEKFEANRAALEPAVNAEIERRTNEAKAKKAIMDSISL